MDDIPLFPTDALALSYEASDLLELTMRITTALYQLRVEEWMNYFQRML